MMGGMMLCPLLARPSGANCGARRCLTDLVTGHAADEALLRLLAMVLSRSALCAWEMWRLEEAG